MKIGLASDSHGRTRHLQDALALLQQRHVEAIVHCGDICSNESVRALGRCGLPVYLVAGNMDRYTLGLGRAARRAGVQFSHETVEVPLGAGQYLIATHGHHERLVADLIDGQQFPYVCYGHTHCRRDKRVGAVRMICPGSLHHPRSPGPPSVAVLDTETDELEFIDLPA